MLMHTISITMDFHHDWSHWIFVLVFAAMDTQIQITSAEFEMNWQPKELNEVFQGLSTDECRDKMTCMMTQSYVQTSHIKMHTYT